VGLAAIGHTAVQVAGSGEVVLVAAVVGVDEGEVLLLLHATAETESVPNTTAITTYRFNTIPSCDQIPRFGRAKGPDR